MKELGQVGAVEERLREVGPGGEGRRGVEVKKRWQRQNAISAKDCRNWYLLS